MAGLPPDYSAGTLGAHLALLDPREKSDLDIRVAYREAWAYLLSHWQAATPHAVRHIRTQADLEAVAEAADYLFRYGLIPQAKALADGAALALSKLERSPFTSPWACDAL